MYREIGYILIGFLSSPYLFFFVTVVFMPFLLLLSTKYNFVKIVLKYINRVALIFVILWGIDNALYSFFDPRVQNFQILKLFTSNHYEMREGGVYDARINSSSWIDYIYVQKEESIINPKKLDYANCFKNIELKEFTYNSMYFYGEDEISNVICEINSSLRYTPLDSYQDARDYNRTLTISQKEEQ